MAAARAGTHGAWRFGIPLPWSSAPRPAPRLLLSSSLSLLVYFLSLLVYFLSLLVYSPFSNSLSLPFSLSPLIYSFLSLFLSLFTPPFLSLSTPPFLSISPCLLLSPPLSLLVYSRSLFPSLSTPLSPSLFTTTFPRVPRSSPFPSLLTFCTRAVPISVVFLSFRESGLSHDNSGRKVDRPVQTHHRKIKEPGRQ